MLETMRLRFDGQWYADRYREFLADFDGDPFDYYLAEGWRQGHDPHPDFSELYYRIDNDDVAQALLRGEYSCGWHHYLQHGKDEERDIVPSSQALHRFFDAAYFHIDPEFVARAYHVDPRRFLSPYDFYFTECLRLPIDPNERFSERGYLRLHADITNAVRHRDEQALCGFMHFLHAGMREQRQICSVAEYRRFATLAEAEAGREALEKSNPRITHPVEFEFARHIGYYVDPVDIELESHPRPGMVVIVPDFMPEILFGGYHCLYRILEDLQDASGLALRLVVLKDIAPADAYGNVHRMRMRYPRIYRMFESIEHLGQRRRLTVPRGWRVLSYACHTHFLAGMMAAATGTVPYFLLQDDEAEFHGAGSLRTFIRSAWDIPHAGIYNSAPLAEHFRAMRPEQFTPDYRWCSFENEIKRLPDTREQFIARHSGKQRRTLVIYARPESHAARNELAVVLVALRMLVQSASVDLRAWRLIGVGSLHFSGLQEIYPGCTIDFVPKLPLGEYEELLKGADVGISLISTPHPGIIHFQMAGFGLVTVTNTGGKRNAEFLRGQSANIVPSALSLGALSEAILRAIELSGDLETRYANAIASRPIDYAAEIGRVVEFLSH